MGSGITATGIFCKSFRDDWIKTTLFTLTGRISYANFYKKNRMLYESTAIARSR
jgi:hypothetical protein